MNYDLLRFNLGSFDLFLIYDESEGRSCYRRFGSTQVLQAREWCLHYDLLRCALGSFDLFRGLTKFKKFNIYLKIIFLTVAILAQGTVIGLFPILALFNWHSAIANLWPALATILRILTSYMFCALGRSL